MVRRTATRSAAPEQATRYAPGIAGPDPTDDELVAAARDGERDALETLLRRHHDRIWAICRRLAGNDADAADACQEALVRIVARLDTFDGRARFTTWAHRVATNACLDELRRRGRRPRPGLPDDAEQGRATVDPGGPLEGSVVDRLSIDAALNRLPESFRVPVVLRDVAGHDYAAIAEILDLPPGTVRSRIARGRAQLASLLVDDGNQPPPQERPSTRP